MGIDRKRQIHLSLAEMVDSWRIFPRILLGGYIYLLYKTISWYMALEPYILKGCKSDNITDCIIQAPTTQHAALVTAVVGIAAAIFGLYTTSGRKWNGFIFWDKTNSTKNSVNNHDNKIQKSINNHDTQTREEY